MTPVQQIMYFTCETYDLMMRKCWYPTSGSAHQGSCVGGRSVDPDSTSDCSIPSVAPGQPGYDWVYAWPGQNTNKHNVLLQTDNFPLILTRLETPLKPPNENQPSYINKSTHILVL